MTSVEQRLHRDAATPGTRAIPDWDDVAGRAARAESRERTIGRAVIGGFVGVVALAAAWSSIRSGAATGEGPAPVASPTDVPWTEPAPFGILLAWGTVWFGAALVAAAVYWSSPQDLRAPYKNPRLKRAASAMGVVIGWASLLFAVAVMSRFAVDSTAFDVLYEESRTVLRWGLFGLGALVLDRIKRPAVLIGVLLATAFGPTMLAIVIELLEDGGDTTGDRLVLLAIAVGTAAVGGFAALRNGYRPTFGWRPPNSRRWMAAALLVATGVVLATVGVAQPVVLEAQVAQLLDDIGFEGEEFDATFPLLDDQAPEYRFREGYEVDDSANTGLTNREIRERLTAVGFEDRDAPVGLTAMRRPRGDSFGGIVVTLTNGGGWLEATVEEPSSFDWMRIVRDLGFALVFVGLLLSWQRTVLSRYLRPGSPFERRSPWIESLGWVFVAAAVGCAIAGVVLGSAAVWLVAGSVVLGLGAWSVRPIRIAETSP